MDVACLGPTCVPILQIHPSRYCNLACQHCYSSSAPEARGGLDPSKVVALIRDAAAEGYRALSISGGEPFLYSGLPDVLRAARECGMQTMVATNGYYIQSSKYRKCRGDIDVLALSIDGLAAAHNAMRGRPDAFGTVMRSAAMLRADGKAFAFIHTVHNRNWHELDQIADIAESVGAEFLQLHPLEVAGRAAQTMQGHGLSRANARRLFLAAHALMVERENIRVHLDLLHRDWVAACPSLAYVSPNTTTADMRLSALLGVLVLDEGGNLLPATYGLNSRYAIMNLDQGCLRDRVRAYVGGRYQEFIGLCNAVHADLMRDPDWDLFNWSDELARKSHAPQSITIRQRQKSGRKLAVISTC